MPITEAMVDAAVRKAIEAGLLARRGSPEEMAAGREIMRAILHAALEMPGQESPDVRKGRHLHSAVLARLRSQQG